MLIPRSGVHLPDFFILPKNEMDKTKMALKVERI
jgi:hypothetical protein